MMHLYWGYKLDHADKLLRTVRIGVAYCGATAVRTDITTDAKKTTCKECLAKYRSPPEPVAAEPEPKKKKTLAIKPRKRK